MEANSPQAFIQTLFEDNMAFFKEKFPNLHSSLTKLSLKNTKINVNTLDGEVDLISGNFSCYKGKGIEFAINEVNEWEKAYPNGKKIATLRPPFHGDYNRPRFFSKRIDELLNGATLTKDNFDWYRHKNPAHMMVFLGVGLGLHIQEYIERHDVRNIIVFENNPEHFLASLYVVDWKKIFAPYLSDKSRTLRLLLREFDDDRDITACIWNELISYCPHFPASCLFYNHRRSTTFGNTIRKLQQDVNVYMNLWGYYDDEINQLNNGMHNFYNKVKKTPSYKDLKFDVPIIIVGSGPSLDERIEQLRHMQDKAIIISCGTAIRSLFHHNIKPDIHVEIESHLLTFELLSEMDRKWLSSISFIGAAQVNPQIYALFNNSLAFIKDSAVMAELFSQPDEIIKGTTPTCTNTGLAIALYYQAREVYMIGTDFGFLSEDQHHTKSSIYYDENADQRIKDSVLKMKDSLIKEISVTGQDMLSKPSYYTAKRRIEVEVLRASKTIKNNVVYNISKGADIVGTKWLDDEALNIQIEQLTTIDKKEILDNIFNKSSSEVTTEMLDSALAKLLLMYNKLKSDIPPMMDNIGKDHSAASAICTQINHYLETSIKPQFPYLYYMVRGSIWHYLYTLYTHTWALEDFSDGESELFLLKWRDSFTSLLNDWPEHIKLVLTKRRDVNDPWIYTPIDVEVENDSIS